MVATHVLQRDIIKAHISPSSDQHQISPCNFRAYSTPEVMTIKDMIT